MKAKSSIGKLFIDLLLWSEMAAPENITTVSGAMLPIREMYSVLHSLGYLHFVCCVGVSGVWSDG